MSASSGNGSDGPLETTSKISLQEELEDRNKELVELRHAHNKLKKALQDRSVELSHGLRRAEHSEAEVWSIVICALSEFSDGWDLCLCRCEDYVQG